MKLSNIELQWLRVVGYGKNGTAYEYDEKVLKSTNNPFEFEAAKKILETPQDWSCKIYAIEDLGNEEYLILKEKVEVAEYDPTDENGEFYGVEGTLNSLENVLHTPWDLCRSWTKKNKTWRDLTEKEINHIAKSQRTKLGSSCYKWFYSAYKAAENFGIDTCDLYHNIGINTKGEFVFFDVMAEK
jgi:hypothetical protein